MTTANELPSNIHSQPLGKRILQGAGLAPVLLIIAIFILSLFEEAPGFGAWILLPLATVTLAGAGGGVFFWLMDHLRHKGTWQKVMANLICFFAYFMGLYLSLVFALAILGYWD